MGGLFRRKPSADELCQQAVNHLSAGDPVQVLACLEAAIQSDPHHVEARSIRSTLFMSVGHLQQAIPDLQALAQLDQANAATHYNNLGSALRETGSHDAGLEAVERAITLDPGYAKPHFNRCQILRDLGRTEEALAAANRALQLDPKYLRAYETRAGLHFLERRFEEAVADYQSCLRLEPKNPMFRAQLGLALSSLGKHQQAMGQFSLAIEDVENEDLTPEEKVWILNNAAVTFGQVGRHDEACGFLSQAIRLETSDPELYFNRGNANLRRGRYALAETDYRRALEFNPEMTAALINCASAQLFQGRGQEGLELLNRVLQAQPGTSVALFNRGRLLRMLGRFAEAVVDLEHVLSLNPEDLEARAERDRALNQDSQALPPLLAEDQDLPETPVPDPPDPPEETKALLQRLQAGESPNTILSEAIAKRSLAAATSALNAGAGIRDEESDTPLLGTAIITNHLGLIGLLLDRGASISEPIAGFSPLAFCVSVWTQDDTEQSKVRTAAFLIHRGAEKNVVNQLGFTPLDDALISEKVHLAVKLRSLGCTSSAFF